MDVCLLWEYVMLTPIPHGILLAVMLNAFNMSADEKPKFKISAGFVNRAAPAGGNRFPICCQRRVTTCRQRCRQVLLTYLA